MIFGSVCSGIEAASVAWEPLGWSASWFAEIEAFPSAVLAHHWPDVPNMGDMTTLAEYIRLGYLTAPDVLVGGTPCQAFSVAGARKSLDDERGQLSLEYIKLANAIDSQRASNESIIVWENVPGVLNTKDNAFGCFLGALAGEECPLEPAGKKWSNAGCVFGPQRAIAWRVLDAQYFGVAQRRRRVFVVASARAGFDPSEILFEFDGVRRDSAPSRETGENSAASAGLGFAESSFGQFREALADGGTLDTQCGYEKAAFQSVTAGRIVVQESPILFEPRSADGAPRIPSDPSLCTTLNTMSGGQREPCLAYSIQGSMIGRNINAGPQGSGVSDDLSFTLTKVDRHAVSYGLVRRLIPKECEMLQGFPDNHTAVPYRNKPGDECPDGPRYAACGNSMAVPVMRWIGSRIDNYVNTK